MKVPDQSLIVFNEQVTPIAHRVSAMLGARRSTISTGSRTRPPRVSGRLFRLIGVRQCVRRSRPPGLLVQYVTVRPDFAATANDRLPPVASRSRAAHYCRPAETVCCGAALRQLPFGPAALPWTLNNRMVRVQATTQYLQQRPFETPNRVNRATNSHGFWLRGRAGVRFRPLFRPQPETSNADFFLVACISASPRRTPG